MNFYIKNTLLTGLVILAMAAVATAQGGKPKMMMLSGDDATVLNELGAVIMATDEGLKVEHAAAADMRAPGYAKVDLQTGDIIVMANGKRMKSIADLRTLLEGLEAGDEVKLGLKRGEGMLIAAYNIASEEELAKGGAKMMTQTVGGKKGCGQSGPVKMELGEGAVPWLDLGAILSEEDGHVVVLDLLPIPSPVADQVSLAKGDRIETIGGLTVTTCADLMKIYDAIAVGEKIALTWVSADKPVTGSFAKPESSGNVMIKKN